MAIDFVPVILCGGTGSRLWPLSRAGFPKQFICLTGTDSLFQQAAQRLAALNDETFRVAAPVVVSNESHRFLVSEQLREIGIELGAALLEPVGRNTAPALSLAALAAVEGGSDPVLVVIPADQAVSDGLAFTQTLHEAIQCAAAGSVVILGIKPDRAETGYGYIQSEAPASAGGPSPVLQFVEKPDAATALRYLADGSYYWNAGIFVLKASVWLRALAAFAPDISNSSQKAWAARRTDGLFIRPGQAEFAAIRSDSIDYAVMEHCAGSTFDLRMLALDANWSDLGAWDAVWKLLPKDEAGNAHVGDVLSSDSNNTLVHASSRLVGVVGVSNLVVVETADAVLVADKSRSQEVRQIVDQLSQQRREEQHLHRKVNRPWGWYDTLDSGDRFKVKRIMVRPKASLSLQKHFHRAEHWVVVKGTAEITNGDQTLVLTENQSTYIPLGEVHRLANPGSIPLEIIEIQTGSYLQEDDIVRLQSDY